MKRSANFTRFVHFTLAVVAFLLCGVSCEGPSIKTGNSPEYFKTYLDSSVTKLMDRYEVPGTAIALIEEGELAWSVAYGYADIDQRRRLTVDAICRTESISKSVTAWAVMSLVEQGLVDFEAPVQHYLTDFELPESRYSWQEVTIRKLLSNSGGLPLGTLGEEYTPGDSMPELREYLKKELQLAYEPGSSFSYSNTGFNLLELIIEEVTGRDFTEYMSAEVLDPLGMKSARYSWKKEWSQAIPMGYDINGNPVAPYVYPAKASGGLFATVEDIARFVIASTYSNENAVLEQQSVRKMHAPEIPITGMFGFVADSYGYGHFIESLSDGGRAVWHGGQGHGWMTHFHLLPESGDGIVIFTNSQRSWPLIAHVLRDWSAWNGAGPVNFSRIVEASSILWGIIGLIIVISLWRLAVVIRETHSGNRTFNFSFAGFSWWSIVDFSVGMATLIILLWAVGQDYLFLVSVFPIGAAYLGWGLLCLSLVFLISALVPKIQPSQRDIS